MAYIKKRGDAYQARVRIQGVSRTKSFDSEYEAEQWAEKTEKEISSGLYHATQNTLLEDALTRYRNEITPDKKGAEQEKNRINQMLKNPLAKLHITEVDGMSIARYRDQRLERGLSPSTVNNDLIVLSHLFTIAKTEWGMTGLVNPVKTIRRPKQPKGRERRLEKGEEDRLMATADPRMQAVITIALETAMRRGEIAELKPGNINFETRIASLIDTKNGERREVPLSSIAISALDSLDWDKTVVGIKADSITKAFIRLCDEIGIDDLRFHDLRHEATSRLFESKKFDLMEVAAITGHKTLSMLKRYTHLRASDLAKRMD